MKAADIPDEVFIEAVRRTPGVGPEQWRMRIDVQATLEGMLERGLPEKLFLAKARKLGLKKKLLGCTDCTCRGDYHLPEEET